MKGTKSPVGDGGVKSALKYATEPLKRVAPREEATLRATYRTKIERASDPPGGGAEARSMRYGIEAERSRP